MAKWPDEKDEVTGISEFDLDYPIYFRSSIACAKCGSNDYAFSGSDYGLFVLCKQCRELHNNERLVLLAAIAGTFHRYGVT